MAYDKFKAHQYYMKHRKLKGKKHKGTAANFKSGTNTGSIGSRIGSSPFSGVGLAALTRTVSDKKPKSAPSVKSVTAKKKKKSSKKR